MQHPATADDGPLERASKAPKPKRNRRQYTQEMQDRAFAEIRAKRATEDVEVLFREYVRALAPTFLRRLAKGMQDSALLARADDLQAANDVENRDARRAIRAERRRRRSTHPPPSEEPPT